MLPDDEASISQNEASLNTCSWSDNLILLQISAAAISDKTAQKEPFLAKTAIKVKITKHNWKIIRTSTFVWVSGCKQTWNSSFS